MERFLEHTRKTFTNLERPWNDEVERVLPAAAPGRWGDIELVLRDADRPAFQ